MHYTYILQSLYNNSYYIGSCDNVKIRLEEHNKGFVKSTKRFRPWKLVYKEDWITLKEARRREFQIKKWKSRKAIERLIHKCPGSSAW